MCCDSMSLVSWNGKLCILAQIYKIISGTCNSICISSFCGCSIFLISRGTPVSLPCPEAEQSKEYVGRSADLEPVNYTKTDTISTNFLLCLPNKVNINNLKIIIISVSHEHITLPFFHCNYTFTIIYLCIVSKKFYK